MRANFARWNHVFIPARKEGRDRFRNSRVGRLFLPLFTIYEALTPTGAAFALSSVIAGALGLDVSTTDIHVVWAGMTGLLFASLLFGRLYRLHGITLEVQVARRVAAFEEATFVLLTRNDGARTQEALRFLGPFLPWDGRFVGAAPGLASLAPGAVGRVEIKATFAERGEHHLDPFRVAALVPLGLSLGPSVHTSGCRFMVVPRPANVRSVRTPTLQRHQPGGVALASKTGESMELHGVRPYRPGDPVRDLHARSWAKGGVPVVREYQQEYFSRVAVVLDTDLGRGDADLLEGAIALSAGLLRRLIAGDALIDLLVVGRTLHPLVLGRSLGTFEQALDLLACANAGPRLAPEELLFALQPHLSRLSCLFFVGLAWDEARARLCAMIREAGVSCVPVVVGAPAAGAAAQAIPLSAISSGEGIVIGP